MILDIHLSLQQIFSLLYYSPMYHKKNYKNCLSNITFINIIKRNYIHLHTRHVNTNSASFMANK